MPKPQTKRTKKARTTKSTNRPTTVQTAAKFLTAHPETEVVDVFYADLCGLVRGKRYPVDQLDKVLKDGLATTGSALLLDTLGECHNPEGLGFSDGDPDCQLKVIPGTLVPAPWTRKPSAQAMVTFVNTDGTPYEYEPRNILAGVVERLRKMKLFPVVAFELEFYLIDRERQADGTPQPPISELTGRRLSGTQVYSVGEVEAFAEFFQDVETACTAQGIETGAITAEYAPGQFEINLQHLDDPMKAADQCVMFKRIVKGVALTHGFEATFMAKPHLDVSGNGLHMHCSLWDGAGRNIFAAKNEEAGETLRHAIGGILDLMPDSMGFLAPNVNSYRRFIPNIYVPVSRSWGVENRSVALRIPLGDGKSKRIEHRIAGADANPYLALATMLAGIHHGITNKIDPGEAQDGNAGSETDPGIPFRMLRALERLNDSKVLKDYLSEPYVRTYVSCKMAELAKFESVISRAEYEWYLQTD